MAPGRRAAWALGVPRADVRSGILGRRSDPALRRGRLSRQDVGQVGPGAAVRSVSHTGDVLDRPVLPTDCSDAGENAAAMSPAGTGPGLPLDSLVGTGRIPSPRSFLGGVCSPMCQ